MAGSALGIVSQANKIYQLIAEALALNYRRERLGKFEFISTLGLLNLADVQIAHWNINCWKDEEMMQWKKTYTDGCNAVAIAGAIFASIGLSALQLPNMDDIHWTVRALFSTSMVFGILSVTSATSLNQQVGRLNSALDIRLWLSRGKGRMKHCEPYSLMPLESSISALKISEIPNLLLNLAVVLFLIGFGLYLLFSWLNHIEQSGIAYRNVFIVFVIAVVVSCLYYFTWVVVRILEAQKRSEEFELIPPEKFQRPSSQQLLQQKLHSVQKLQGLRGDEEEYLKKVKECLEVLQLQEIARGVAEEA